MELLSTIINELTDIGISLTSPLLKTKVLATRIQNDELLAWVNNELIGYNSIKKVPLYRTTRGEICADYINGTWKVTNQVIELPSFDKEISDLVYQMHFTQSVQTLEALCTNSKSYVAEIFDQGQKEVLVDYLKNQNPYLNVLSICRRTPSNFIIEMLSNIRGRLLEFILQLEEKYQYISEIRELKSHNKEITHLMNTTITNVGDGNVINTGNKAKITAAITVTKGNKEQLQKVLEMNDVDPEDITDLLNFIDEEQPRDNKFGSQVNSWVQKMISKSLDGSWQIGVGAAGTLLAEALSSYYGA